MSKNYPITQAKFAAALANLKLPSSNTGTFVPPGHSEITLGYAFVPGATPDALGDLQVNILHKSWLEPASVIFSNLDPYFA